MDTGKFSKAKVYKITDVNYTKCYIGSTCEELSQRMARHRYMYNQHINRGKESHRTANVLFDEFGIHNCKIELLEEYSCNNLMELHRREGYYIQNNNCVNKRVEGRTDEEYRQQNDAKEKERHKIYYENNKDKRKEYNDKNKDYISQWQKDYRQKNMERLQERKSEKYTCGCGSVLRRGGKSEHQKSQKHQEWLKQQEPEEEAEPVEQSN